MITRAALAISIIHSKVLAILGWLFGLYYLLGIVITPITFTFSGIGAISLLYDLANLALCVGAIIWSRKIKERIKRYKLYVMLISTRGMTSIDDLSDYVHMTPQFVKKDVEGMIFRKYFANASIDPRNNEIVISNKSHTDLLAQVGNNAPTKEVTCKNCGGSNRIIVGKVVKCMYCGSFLE